MTLVATRPDGFAHGLAVHGGRIALWAGDETVTYLELEARVQEAEARLGPFRRLVQLQGANRIDAVVALLAALRTRNPVLLTTPGDTSIGAAYEPDVVIDVTGGAMVLEERRATSAHALHPDLALLLSTSGTTGSAKLVRLSHENLDANATAIGDALGIRTSDRAMTTLPMHYCYGLSVITSHLARGAGLVLSEHSVVDRCFWADFDRHAVTTLAGVPHTFDLFDRIGFEQMELPSLRCVTQAGGRLAPDKVRRFAALGRERGWDLVVMYGQTEATARMACLPPHLAERHPTAIGLPIPGGSFDIDDGELVYRGPNVMLGYATNPADLALGATLDELRTGDLARRNDDGLFEIVGRRSRFLKLFGLRVGLDDVESRLAARGITALCGGDDERLVVVVDDPLVEDDAVLAVCADVGVPAARVGVLRLPALPRLESGKPDHAALARLAAETTAPASTASVASVFAEILRCDVEEDSTFVGLGGDSLSYVELSVRLEELIGHLPDDWYLRPMRDLQPVAARTAAVRHVETNVALRAIAIVLVVATHVGPVEVPGSAHLLLAVAGFNFARFQLVTGPAWRSIARVAVPAMCWIGLVAAVAPDFSLSHALLLHGVVGDPDGRWAYWFVEALVALLVPLTLALHVRPLRRLERRRPFAAATALLLAGVAIRFDVLPTPDLGHRIYRPHEVLWLFALGWALAVATSRRQRLVATAVGLVAVIGFFGDPGRELLVVAGVVALGWVPRIAVVPPLNRVLGTVAGASLAIYLTHFQLYPALRDLGGSLVAIIGSIAVGVIAWCVCTRAAFVLTATRS
ncbi:MAG TPA: AMP-binding protein [Acidimicrobiales bacterium]|nr:AMP-binding protein [Acidimicrobiales bacterium]